MLFAKTQEQHDPQLIRSFIKKLLQFVSLNDPHRFLPIEAVIKDLSLTKDAQRQVEQLPMFDTIRVSGTLLFRLSSLYPVHVVDSLNRPLSPTKAARADNMVRVRKAEWHVATPQHIYIKLTKPAVPALWTYVFYVPGDPGKMRVHDISCNHIHAVHHVSSVRYVEPTLSPNERWNVMLVAQTPSQMAALLELVRTTVGVAPENVVPCRRCRARLPVPVPAQLPLTPNYDEVYKALVSVLDSRGYNNPPPFVDVEQMVNRRTHKRVDRNYLESWFRTLTDNEEKSFSLFFEERENGRTETTPAPAPEQNQS